MKNKGLLIMSIIQLVIGAAATAAFVMFTVIGDSAEQWVVSFVLAVVLIALGIAGIVKYVKARRDAEYLEGLDK